MLSKEQINSAMLSSLEGFSFSVVDSLEFELSRKLTASEQQEVFVIVERVVSDSASLREQLAELKALQPVAEFRRPSKKHEPMVYWFGKQSFPVGTQLFTAAKPEALPRHIYSMLVNELRDVPAIGCKRELIVSVLNRHGVIAELVGG